MRLAIVREGKPLNVQAIIRPARVVIWKGSDWKGNDVDQWSVETFQSADDRYLIGVTLAEVNATLRAQLKLPEGQGLVVTEVIPESAAAAAGLQTNDILISLDGQSLSTIEKINEQVQAIADRKVALKILRAGEERSIEITPRKKCRRSRSGALRHLARPSRFAELPELPPESARRCARQLPIAVSS